MSALRNEIRVENHEYSCPNCELQVPFNYADTIPSAERLQKLRILLLQLQTHTSLSFKHV